VVTRSAHRLMHPKFNRAIADYLERERLDVNAYVNELNEHAPFKDRATADEREQAMKLKPQMNAD
jgi:predicted N-acyltransferase